MISSVFELRDADINNVQTILFLNYLIPYVINPRTITHRLDA